VVLARIANNFTEIGSGAVMINDLAYHDLRIIADQATIKVFVDNMVQPLIETTDNSYTTGAFGFCSYNTDAFFTQFSTPEVTPKCFADTWYRYPNTSGPAKKINQKAWDGAGEKWYQWWFEHIPKNPGTHDAVDIVNGETTRGILNTWWPYIFDINRFGNGSGYQNLSFPQADITPPNAVTYLRKSYGGTTSMTLAWDEPTDNIAVTRYDIYRDNIFLQQVCNPFFTINYLNPATTYTFKIIARDASGNESQGTTLTTSTD
jgi:hypothetical protein